MHEGQYPLADGGTANFVVGMKNCLNETHAMNSSNTNAGGWNGCEMRTWLNNTVYNSIPESFRSVLKAMNVWTANGGNQAGSVGIYSEDYLALPAEKEVFGSNTYGSATIESQLFQFDWYKTASNRIKQISGSNEYWWERSHWSGGPGYFCFVVTSGSANWTGASNSYGVSFFGCI